MIPNVSIVESSGQISAHPPDSGRAVVALRQHLAGPLAETKGHGMKIKFGVARLLFACGLCVGASSAADADDIREDRYPVIVESGAFAQPRAARMHRARKHVRTFRKLRTREVAARHEEPALARPALASSGQSSLDALIAAKAAAHGVPVHLAHAVVRVESNYHAAATGRAGEVGLMQIKHQTARGLGYTGTRAALYDPATNLEWGLRYLSGAHRLAGGNLCGTLAKYQGGHGTRGTRTSHNYCGRVRTVMSARGA
jgi:soluble lytic murein transglycosylase-like protein